MQLFTKIDDAAAIISLPGGVQKQVEMYQRGGRVYVAAKGGFIRVCCKFGDTCGTSNPNIKVIDFEAAGVIAEGMKEPAFNALRAAA